MLEIIKVLQSTPIPVLLIVGGLFFLLLGFVTKIGGVIEVSPEQKKWTIPIGLMILTIGLVINFTPNHNQNNGNGAIQANCQSEQKCWDGLHEVAQVWDVNSAKNYLSKLEKSNDPCTAKFAKIFGEELNKEGSEGFKNINNIKRSISQESNCQLPIKSFEFAP